MSRFFVQMALGFVICSASIGISTAGVSSLAPCLDKDDNCAGAPVIGNGACTGTKVECIPGEDRYVCSCKLVTGANSCSCQGKIPKGSVEQ